MDRVRFPDALVLVFAMIVGAQLLTYVIPSGQYAREPAEVVHPEARRFLLPPGASLHAADSAQWAPPGGAFTLPGGAREAVPGRRVQDGTYHHVPAEPLPWHAFLTRIPAGMAAASEIIFFVFIVGGVIAVVRRTGALDAMIGAALHRFGHSPVPLIAGMLTLFAVGASTIGMAEEYIAFVPILVAMCLALRMDAVVALGIVYIGAGVGYASAALNPFTVLIAKSIAGQDPATGFWLRWALLAVLIAVGVQHLLAYSRRIQADPARSLVAGIDYSHGFALADDVRLTPRRTLVLLAFVAMIALFVWGVERYEWYLVELAALFLGVALFAAAAGRLSPNTTARAFIDGAAELTGTALLIGFARTIEVLLNDARVIDTVIHGIAGILPHHTSLGRFTAVLSAWGMLGLQSVMNFLIPSGSGQAYVTMPIMAPLADLTGVGRETAVLAYQLGDGITNMVIPTNALLMGMLVLARIPYGQWLRFILPLVGKLFAVSLAVLAVAAWIRWQ